MPIVEIYESYCKWCWSINVKPADLETWFRLSDESRCNVKMRAA